MVNVFVAGRVSFQSDGQDWLELSINGNCQWNWSKGSDSIVNRRSVSLGRSKCMGLIN